MTKTIYIACVDKDGLNVSVHETKLAAELHLVHQIFDSPEKEKAKKQICALLEEHGEWSDEVEEMYFNRGGYDHEFIIEEHTVELKQQAASA